MLGHYGYEMECRIIAVQVYYAEHGDGVLLIALRGAGVDHREIEAARRSGIPKRAWPHRGSPGSRRVRRTGTRAAGEGIRFGYADAIELLEHYPHATLAVIDNAGHAVMHERPDLRAALLGDWLDRARAESPLTFSPSRVTSRCGC